jgi:hypothetical protein
MIRNDQSIITQCASTSQRHPLGHDKIMLLNTDPTFRLRLHAWWPDRTPGVEHVHQHRFDFASVVLRGGYEMQVFQVADSGTQMIEYHQYTSPEEKEWRLDAAGPACLQLTATTIMSEGTSYGLTSDDLHRVIVPDDKLCLTLFLAITQETNWSAATRVYAAPREVTPTQLASSALAAENYVQRLEAIMAELARSPRPSSSPLVH